MRKISKNRVERLAKEGRVLKGTFKAKTISEVTTAQQARARKLFSKPKTGKTDRQKAKAAADKYFSMFIRLRDSDEYGIATCVTSGRRGHWKTMDAGHWISRAKEATRYDERNVHAQSKQANRFQGGHFLEHEKAIERIHGAGTAQALKDKALALCKRTASDYRFIADTYRSYIELIRAREPNKFKP